MEGMVLTISEEDIKEDMMMEDTQVILREEDNTYNSSVIFILYNFYNAMTNKCPKTFYYYVRHMIALGDKSVQCAFSFLRYIREDKLVGQL